MTKNKNTCDCELCLYKTFPLDNPLANDSTKVVEAIIYHFIFRLGHLVKSKKELNSHVIKFITMVNQSYLPLSTDIKETITTIYKKIIDSGQGCHFSTNVTLTKHIQKETTYLKLIISSMEEKEVISPITIVIDDVIEVIYDIKTIKEDVEKVIDDIKTIKNDIVEDHKNIQDASGSYYSYCIIS